jgi:hypothetical protein
LRAQAEIVTYKPLMDFTERSEEISNTIDPKSQTLSIFTDVISRVDPKEVSNFQKKYASSLKEFASASRFKYADLPFWILDKINVAMSLDLHRCEKKSILDIGMGGGHFAMVCGVLGHKVVGTDKSVPLYDDICRIFRSDRRFISTELRRPLQDLGTKFDMIVVIGQIFNFIKPIVKGNIRYWTPDDWSFFLKDLIVNHMRYPGSIFLQLNPNIAGNGTERDKVLLQWTRDHGATADEVTNRVLFSDIGGWDTLEAVARTHCPAETR